MLKRKQTLKYVVFLFLQGLLFLLEAVSASSSEQSGSIQQVMFIFILNSSIRLILLSSVDNHFSLARFVK
jgi:hypothetical protein